MAEGARLESVFRGNSNVGSNPTLSASFSTTYVVLHAVLHAIERQACYLLTRNGHFIGNDITIDVECGPDISMAHKFLLHGDWCPYRIKP